MSLHFPGSQPGPSQGLSLMSSQGSVDSDHLGKLGAGGGAWRTELMGRGLGAAQRRSGRGHGKGLSCRGRQAGALGGADEAELEHI